MFFNSTLVLVSGSDSSKIRETYGELVNRALYNTMNRGFLDIMVLKSQNTIREVELLTATFYDLARSEILALGNKRNIRVTVLLDGRNIELSRKQYWEVIMAGKYGMLYSYYSY